MKRLFLFLSISVFFSSCALMSFGSFRSGVQIPAGEEFLLGEYTKEAFDVELNNTCYCDVPIETRNSKGEKTGGFGLAKRGKVKLTVRAGEHAVLLNPHSATITVNAVMQEQVYGMRYQALSDSVSFE